MVVTGSRKDAPADKVAALLPELRRRDVFVSGSEDFVTAMRAALAKRRVPESSIHWEEYAL